LENDGDTKSGNHHSVVENEVLRVDEVEVEGRRETEDDGVGEDDPDDAIKLAFTLVDV
jgi:hypothetical protein